MLVKNESIFIATKEFIASVSESQDRDLYEFQEDKWYFWNETLSDAIGPYDTEEDAIVGMQLYNRQLSLSKVEKRISEEDLIMNPDIIDSIIEDIEKNNQVYFICSDKELTKPTMVMCPPFFSMIK